MALLVAATVTATGADAAPARPRAGTPPQAAAPSCDASLAAAKERQPLSVVLRRIAAGRPFDLHVWTADDPLVSQGSGTRVEVVQALLADVNSVVRLAPDDRCPGRVKVQAVWILPRGEARAVSAATSAAARPAVAPQPRSAANAEAVKMFMKAHGARAGSGGDAARPGR